MTFESDLDHYLAAYEREAEQAEQNEAWFATYMPEWQDDTYTVEGESARLIPEYLILEPNMWTYRDDRECLTEA